MSVTFSPLRDTKKARQNSKCSYASAIATEAMRAVLDHVQLECENWSLLLMLTYVMKKLAPTVTDSMQSFARASHRYRSSEDLDKLIGE